jgi:peptidoglycan/xylan/chitin deacetylase (PgdA/CDA1 family)
LRYEEQFNEINTSKQILEKLLKRKIEHFSYPYGGRGDYNDHSINICKEIGFKMVSANRYGQVHSWTNAYEVPRILVRNWNKAEFKKKVEKFFKY